MKTFSISAAAALLAQTCNACPTGSVLCPAKEIFHGECPFLDTICKNVYPEQWLPVLKYSDMDSLWAEKPYKVMVTVELTFPLMVNAVSEKYARARAREKAYELTKREGAEYHITEEIETKEE